MDDFSKMGFECYTEEGPLTWREEGLVREIFP